MGDNPSFHWRRRELLLGGLLSLCTGLPAGAEPYPSTVIRIVVPAVAGTPPDIISRLVANELGQTEGWHLIVENRPGALQTIAMSDVGKRPADGYSLLAMSVPMNGHAGAASECGDEARCRFRGGRQNFEFV